MIYILSIIMILAHSLFLFAGESRQQINERLSRHSLNHFSKTVYSQNGEDGIIEEIFKRLNIENGFFVEFGANDGIWLSNTRYLWEKGWKGAMIEANDAYYPNLIKNYKDKERILCIKEFVWFNGARFSGKSFDQIADQMFKDVEIDFLSIDIDGADYLILESLQRRPKVICIEVGIYWHPYLNVRIPDEYAFQNRQQPLEIMFQIAHGKGYEPICFEGGNLFLIRKDLHKYFADVPKDTLTIWRDGWRSCPQHHDYILNLRKTCPIIRMFEDKELNKVMPITKEF